MRVEGCEVVTAGAGGDGERDGQAAGGGWGAGSDCLAYAKLRVAEGRAAASVDILEIGVHNTRLP